MEAQQGDNVHQYPVGHTSASFARTNSKAAAKEAKRAAARMSKGMNLLKKHKSAGMGMAVSSAAQQAYDDDRGEDDELLDACHSHFIFIDSDTKPSIAAHVDVARRKRNAIEQHISNSDMSGDGIETPVVTVVLGGDPKSNWTLKEVRQALLLTINRRCPRRLGRCRG